MSTTTTRSMTGFGRASGEENGVSWSWELRSVNSRGLDIRLRLPPGYDMLEPLSRKALTAGLERGSITATLEVKRVTTAPALRVNTAVLETVIAAAEDIRDRVGGSPLQAEQVLALRGVLETVEAEETPDAIEQRAGAVLKSLDAALKQLVAARTEEGARLHDILADRIAQIEACVAKVGAHPSRTPEAIRARLAQQIARIMEAEAANFDQDRLLQEAAILATRADVEEEVKRLNAHIAAARDLLREPGAVGRRLEFLAQEFNREANTLCSKANDIEITELGLRLKSLIDQVREQVQNVE